MKEFTALYQQLDPHASSAALAEAKVGGEEEKEEKQQPEEVEEKVEPRSEAADDAAVQGPVRSVDESKSPSSSSSSSSTSSPPVYRSSSSSSKKKRAKAKSGAGCVNCHQNDRLIGAHAMRSLRLRELMPLRLHSSPALSRATGQLVLCGVQAAGEAGVR